MLQREKWPLLRNIVVFTLSFFFSFLDIITRWRNLITKERRTGVNMDISKMSEPELKTMIIKIQVGLEKSIQDTKQSLTVEIKELKYSHAKIKNAITEMR